jgi:hypothetical protein
MKSFLTFGGLLVAGALSFGAATPASATTVATIDGCYDCVVFDTPTLIIHNSTGGVMSGAQMVLHGYQGDNNGISLTVGLGNLGTGATTLNWGSLPGVSGATTPGNLAAYDYDDEYIGTALQIPTTDCGQPVAGCVAGGGPQWYAQTGNFDVTFTAIIQGGTYDGQSVFSVFSPTTNATGHFVGWEGLDEQGFSESPYDVHSDVITGNMANIDLGVPPPPGGVPEPGVWALMLMGFFGAGAAVRRGRQAAVAA